MLLNIYISEFKKLFLIKSKVIISKNYKIKELNSFNRINLIA